MVPAWLSRSLLAELVHRRCSGKTADHRPELNPTLTLDTTITIQARNAEEGDPEFQENPDWEQLDHDSMLDKIRTAGVVGLGAAVDYLQAIGMRNIADYEHDLHSYMISELKKVGDIRLIGEAREQASVQSFLLGDIHSHDLGTILDHQGIAIRTGHHCAMPVMQHFGISGTARASVALYNNRDDVDRLIAALGKAREIFA